MVITSVHPLAIMLKLDARWARFRRHSSNCLNKFNNNYFRCVGCILSSSFTEPIEVFCPTKSMSLSNLVVWRMWRWARKWVQWIRALIAILFFNFSWSWSGWTIDPSSSCSHLCFTWLDLNAWVFILLIAFFHFLKGFEIHIPPVLWLQALNIILIAVDFIFTTA